MLDVSLYQYVQEAIRGHENEEHMRRRQMEKAEVATPRGRVGTHMAQMQRSALALAGRVGPFGLA